MTKYEIAMEIMKNLNWDYGQKVNFAHGAVKHHSKAHLEELYNEFLNDKENAKKYALLL